jgi:hypothetical protein
MNVATLGDKMNKLLFSFLMLFSLAVYADSVGLVLSASDGVTAKQGGAERKLSRGSALMAGDSIVTAATAKAQIKYTNGTIVSIDPGSTYAIVSYDPKAEVVLKTELNSGSIKSDSNSKAQKKSIVKTPMVALAILGTEMQVKVSNDNTFVNVTKGTVCVINLDNNKVEQPCLGPQRQLLSGTFDRNRKFTPGTLSSPEVLNSTAVTISQTVSVLSTTTTVNSVVPAIQQVTGIADIIIF